MGVNFVEFESKIVDSLKASGLIERFKDDGGGETVDQGIITRFFKTPSLIFFDDRGMYFEDENEKVYCPEIETSVSDGGAWLSSKLPLMNLDIDQSGNVRKADEVEALYECMLVAHILNSDDFKTDLNNIVQTYNFDEMVGENEIYFRTFRELINKWLKLQSVYINVIVSAAKYQISDQKKGAEKFLKDGLGERVVAELRDLDAKIRAVNFEYSTGALDPSSIKKMTKIERLTLIDERDSRISDLIVASRVGTLKRAMSMSSEFINPVKKLKLQEFISREVIRLCCSDEFKGADGVIDSLTTQFKRRAYKFEIASIRRLAVEKYMSDPENFRMPPKQ